MYPKIDFHVHYLTDCYKAFLRRNYGVEPEGFPTPAWNLENQIKMMEDNGIRYGMLGISSPYFCCGDEAEEITAVRENNRQIAMLLKGYESRLGYLAALPTGAESAALKEIERAMNEGALGFSLSTHANGAYLGNPIFDPLMEELNRRKSIVHIHPTCPSAVPEDACAGFPIPAMEFFFDTTRAFVNMCLMHVFERWPDIQFIFSHGGALVPLLSDRLDVFFKRREEELDIHASLGHAYYDLAGYIEPKQLSVLLMEVPEDHLLYGSDYPHTGQKHVAQNRKRLEETEKLTDRQKQKIFWKNGKRLLSHVDALNE